MPAPPKVTLTLAETDLLVVAARLQVALEHYKKQDQLSQDQEDWWLASFRVEYVRRSRTSVISR